MLKMIILPRKARDRHRARAALKTETAVFSQMVQLHAKHGPPTEPLFPEGTEGPAEGPVSSLQLLNFRSCDQLTDAFCRLEKKPNLFCMPLYTQTDVTLPRQARDKHRESTQKERCVL
jgi:hypothetical protein